MCASELVDRENDSAELAIVGPMRTAHPRPLPGTSTLRFDVRVVDESGALLSETDTAAPGSKAPKSKSRGSAKGSAGDLMGSSDVLE
jgi:hypothetical protein